MNNIKINISIDSLSRLTPIGTDTYQLAVKFYNSNGSLLVNSNIPNPYVATVTTTSTSFSINVPITEGIYSIPDVTVRVFANNESNCCFAFANFDLDNDFECNFTVDATFIQCNRIIGTELANGTPPYIINVTEVSDPTTERFLDRAGSFVFYNPIEGAATYKVKFTDANGCMDEDEISITCNPTAPTFDSSIVQPVCNGTNLTPGNVRLSNVSNGTRYKVCYNNTFTCGDCGASDGFVNQTGDTVIGIFPAPQGQTQNVVIRVYNGDSCDVYTDFPAALVSPTCASGCTLTFTINTPTCTTIPVTVTGASGGLTISVRKVGEGYERYRSYSSGVIGWEPATDGNPGTYNVQITDAAGCSHVESFTITCGGGGPGPDPKPNGAMEYTQPSCNNGNLVPGTVRFYNMVNATRYKICYGTGVFNCDNCSVSDGNINQSGDTFIPIFPPTQGTQEVTTIRIYNGTGCDAYIDATILMTSPVCGGNDTNINICNSSNSAGGVGGSREYVYLNNTSSQLSVYWEWYTSNFPDRLRVQVNNITWFDTFCAGPLPNTCNPPGSCQYQPEYTYGKIDLPVGSTVKFIIDGDCGGGSVGGTVWGFKSKCVPFNVAPVTYTGAAIPCSINISQAVTSGGNTIYIDRWGGGTSGQYQFGIQPESAANVTTVNWVQDNTIGDPDAGMLFTGLTTGVNYRVWIRDKNNTGCLAWINRTP